MSTEMTNSNSEDIRLRAEIDRSLRHPVMFFFTSGAAWLAVSLIFGIIASAKVHAPQFLGCCEWFSHGRVMQAHMATFIYGWGFQAAFGVMIWLMARLSRQTNNKAGTILVLGHVWNAMIAIGTLAILMGNGSGVDWLQFPKAIWPVLIGLYFLISIWSVISFRVRRGGHIYISQWYLIGAFFWLPWILTTGYLFAIVFRGESSPLMADAVVAWVRSALLFLFFAPVAIASAYYIAPKVTGRPVYSYSLAIFGFWALAVIAPWTGLQKLLGTPLPAFMPYISAGATILLLVPILVVTINIVMTAVGKGDVMAASPSLRFTTTAIIGLLVAVSLSALNAIPAIAKYTQFSTTNYGIDMLLLFGCFSMAMFGAIYFIVPRITNREWLSAKLIRQHFWLSVYGLVFIALIYTLMGGFMHGYVLEKIDETAFSTTKRLYPYAVGMTVSWAFILIASAFFCCHLLLMWLRLGRKSSHPTLLVRQQHNTSR